jgi:hypothetical protein
MSLQSHIMPPVYDSACGVLRYGGKRVDDFDLSFLKDEFDPDAFHIRASVCVDITAPSLSLLSIQRMEPCLPF